MLIWVVLAPVLAAMLLWLFPVRWRLRWPLALLGAAAPAGVLLPLWTALQQDQVPRLQWSWMPALGLSLDIRVDGLAWSMALLIALLTTLIVVYTRYYLAEKERPERFLAWLLLFQASMLGLVLAGNLLWLVVCWELTSLTSFLLVGYHRHKAEARDSARLALTVTGLGGLALFGGVLLLGRIVGSFELDAVLAAGPLIRDHALYPLTLVLILLGAFSKSAQFPFHFWLPQAMTAPTPASALLHSATLVKAGIFLLARLHPALAGTDLWFHIVTATGLLTLAVGAWHAIFQQDIKGLLAYSTISHLGLIVLLLGLGTPLAVVAACFHLLNHALFKASLFMAAGIIDHETGTRDFRQLNGLWRHLPYTGALAIVASLAMAGVPLLNGFLSKEMFLAETLSLRDHPFWQTTVPTVALLAGICAVAYSLRFVHDVFFNGSLKRADVHPHEPPRWMRIPIEVLLMLCLAVGVAPQWTIGPVLAVMAGGVLGDQLPGYSLALWHGFNLPLLMSLLGLVGGVLLYFGLQRKVNLHRIERPARARQWFDGIDDVLDRFGSRWRRRMLSLRLTHHAQWLVGFALLVMATAWINAPWVNPDWPAEVWTLGSLAATGALLMLLGTLAAVLLAPTRLGATLAVGLAGLLLTGVFAWFSAPDLALTQLLIETASVVLLVIALRRLPAHAPRVQPSGRIAWVLSITAGLAVAWLTWLSLQGPLDSVSAHVLRSTLDLAGGTNAVNTIIVDYRGFDTLGEITVLAVTALILDALLRRPATPVPPPLHDDGGWLPVALRALWPLGMLLSAHFFLRGHNLPGGGFIAGLVLVLALVLHRLGHALPLASSPHPRPLQLTALGLIVAAGTGLGSMAFGLPFLTSATPHLHLPLLGEIHLPSAALFDTGVWLVVVGSCLMLVERALRLSAPPLATGGRP